MRVTRRISPRLTTAARAATVLTLLAGASGVAGAQTITATATGSLNPALAPPNQTVQNGDLLIAANLLARVTGDGIDELNTWTFDFTSDPSYPVAGPLLSAKLTLTLKPGNGGIATDLVGITDPAFTSFIPGGPVITPVIQGLPVGVVSTVTIQLLNNYTSAQILAALSSNNGKLPMLYHDDAVLSFAQLELVSVSRNRQAACDSDITRIKSVTRPNFTPTMVDFEASGGGLDPTPLLQTTVNVAGEDRSCLVVNFSTMARPLDDYIVFQVRVDGVPMEGHLSSFGGFATPVVADPEETNKKLPRMVAYTFFKEVSPGPHRVQVFFAGCCSVNPPAGSERARAGSPVLAVHYR